MDPAEYNRQRLTRWLIGAALLLILLLVIRWLINYLNTGQITVITEGKSSISISRIVDGVSTRSAGSTGTNSLTARLHSGEYIISVGGKSITANRKAVLHARQHLTYKILPPKPKPVETVLGQGGLYMAADATHLVYMDPSTNQIEEIGPNDGPARQVYPGPVYQKVEWINTGFGIARTADNRLLVLKHGAVSPLHLPQAYKSGTKLDYSVASDGTLFLSMNKNVYYTRNYSSYKKVYTAPTDKPELVAAKGKVAVIEPVADEPQEKDESQGGPNIAVVSISGSKAEREIQGISEYQLAWSPDGSKLAIAGGSLSGKVLDSSLKTVADLPNYGVSSPYWLDRDTLLYGADGLLWKYGVKDDSSSVMANLGPGNDINQMALDKQGAYLYLSVSSTSSDQSISRIPLKGQSSPVYLQTLGSFLPETIGVCELDYLNFIKPTITIRYPDSGTDPALCVKSAKGELRYYDINPDDFGFVTIPFKQAY